MPVSLSNTAGVHTPNPGYSHIALITGPARRLLISGQIGMAPDGTVPEDVGGQMDQALANIAAHLAAHGMGLTNLVRFTVYLLDAAAIPVWRQHRNAFMQGHEPTSTLLIISALADPRFLVEIEAEAAD